MSIKALFSNFDRLIQSPESRATAAGGSFWTWAVRGKLVPQDPKDEPATELLKRIAKEKKKNQTKWLHKEPFYYPSPKMNKLFPIPKSWEWVRLGYVSTSLLGKTLNKAKNRGTYKSYLRSVNVYWLELKLSDIKEMKFEEQELEKYALCKGRCLSLRRW